MFKIRVLDVETEQIFYECSIEESESAYAQAAQLEELGLNVRVHHPTLSETLTSSLGLSHSETQDYLDSMDEELEQHAGSCCFEVKTTAV